MLKYIIYFVLLCGCATSIPNAPICVEITPDRGSCVKIISGEQFTIDETHPFKEGDVEYTWWTARPILLMMPPSSWAEIKKFIIKMCKKYESACQQEASSWDRTINNIDDQIGLKK